MLVRPFGLLGARYEVSKKGKRAYFLGIATALLSSITVAVAGLIHINQPGTVSWPVVTALVMLFIFMTIYFVGLTVKHGEIVSKKR